MKKLLLSLLCFIVFVGVQAQEDSVFIYKNGVIVYAENVKLIDSITFNHTLLPPGKISDYDGNEYATVIIGTQRWTTENLKTTHLNDGTLIPNITINDDWKYGDSSVMSWYQNDLANKDIYGGYYKGYTVKTGKLCPSGWHVPTLTDWETLINHLGASTSGEKIKTTGETYWVTPNFATNETGFNARGGNSRSKSGGFVAPFGYNAWFWSSTDASGTSIRVAYVNHDSKELKTSWGDENDGFNTRCIENQ